MIVLAGRTYEATIGSDVQRDGMYLELADQHGHIVGQIFFSDFDRKMTVTLFESEVSVEVVEWMIATAKIRLPPTNPTLG
ncbi:hypothetical protein EOA60_13595 [Mesorhizobium sp. M1A.F.Ca.IN.020.06.1.1]|uniref:hypothetical protein n=1 Tax=unclassified Mesorhizobium TaxID=325217 RepID=UPI000BAF70A5|nr:MULTISPECIES: hypothetical protein [unclassified Mesorhizobium]PBB31052.1 hypothetical protein CK214_18670 [Mesorhizobium sp. WSM3882]RUU97256.1 hypothetical protein EOA79_25215 [Mesorhizobium sp. M1A.F.Ca.IN.020.03.2.1]RUV87461.1 hypothetical protein EOA51_11020 [Mesorhizobium sp. M1A.F.Ca.IN.020.32.1.1]RUW09414.1 hypothetical protein EOA46_18145 [Mesorhizobium sp. M1A.F.Ca.IN.022.05.2.1]RUW30366.1 hypothetical protein EOA60_13595 [Mesorhizobium sp. M1A.F.Ca.IN.020.06.1.1]